MTKVYEAVNEPTPRLFVGYHSVHSGENMHNVLCDTINGIADVLEKEAAERGRLKHEIDNPYKISIDVCHEEGEIVVTALYWVG